MSTPSDVQPRSQARVGRATWLPVAIAMFCCGWGGNQFTPLLVMYREAGYSTFVVDALLGAYVVGLVPALLVVGKLSQRYGRKPVMITGTVLSMVASVLVAMGVFGAGWIALGRFVTGVGLAVAMAVGSIWLQELSELDGAVVPGLGARRSAMWLTLGLGAGPGVAGVLAQWAPWPMVLPYLVHVLLCVGALAVVWLSPETLEAGAEADELQGTAARSATSWREGVGHPRFLGVVVPMAPWVFGSLGIAYAVMPQVVGDRLGSWGLAYSTLLTICALGAGVGAQPVAKRLDHHGSARAALTAMVILCIGLGLSAGTAVTHSPWLALVAAFVLGIAYGIALVAGLLELQRLADDSQVATLTGVYYAVAYVGFLFPAILAALSPIFSYVAMLLAVTALALVGTVVVTRNYSRHLPA